MTTDFVRPDYTQQSWEDRPRDPKTVAARLRNIETGLSRIAAAVRRNADGAKDYTDRVTAKVGVRLEEKLRDVSNAATAAAAESGAKADRATEQARTFASEALQIAKEHTAARVEEVTATLGQLVQILLRRDPAATWTSTNPVLGTGELGVELDTHLHKLGDGTTPWNSLPYPGDARYAKPRGAWTATTAYTVNDTVVANGVAWRCITAHTSGSSFSADPTKWQQYGVGQIVTARPGSPYADQVIYNKTTEQWERYDSGSSTWKQEGSGAYLAPTFPEAHGVLGNGTDESTAIQAMLTASAGKVVYWDPAKVYRADSALTLPAGYNCWRSLGGPADPSRGSTVAAGPRLDLRFNGFRVQALQWGTFDCEGILFINGGTSSGTFVLCTVTTPRIGRNVFQGRTTVSGATCDEDAVQLGGTDTTQTAGVTTSAFAGYGGWVEKNTHSRIRRGILARNFVNGIPVDGHWFDVTCGSNLTPDAPIVLDSGGFGAGNINTHACQGNVISRNTIELMSAYTHGVRLVNNACENLIFGNGFWDKQGGGAYVADVHVDEATNCVGNTIRFDGFSNLQISGVTAGGGHNFVELQNEIWWAQSALRMAAGSVLYLSGTNDAYRVESDTTNQWTAIRGQRGVLLRSADVGAQFMARASAASPNGSAVGSVGDVCSWPTGGGGQHLWTKETGAATNTGWAPVGTTIKANVVTASYSATTDDMLVVVAGSSTGVTITLPDPATVPYGRTYRVKNLNANAATVNSAGSGITIDFASTVTLNQHDKVTVWTDNSEWYVIA